MIAINPPSTVQQSRSNKAAAIAEYQLRLAREIAQRAKLEGEPAVVAAVLQAIASNFAAYTN